MKKLNLILLISLFTVSLFSQNQKSNDSLNAHVRLKSRYQKGHVLLRWAVDEPVEWQRANKIGFMVERSEYYTNKEGKKAIKSKILTKIPIKTAALNEWRDIAQQNDNAAIIAQAIYGETFSIDAPSSPNQSKNDFNTLMRKTEDLRMRHGFSLLSADMSFEAACLAGWGFVDSTAEMGKEYFYLVYLANDRISKKVEMGVTSLKTNETGILAPLFFKSNFKQTLGTFTWDNEIRSNEYTAYWLERSDDNINFKATTQKPIINIVNPEVPSKEFSYKDTLPGMDKTYYYRLRGITCFGELSEPTEVIKGLAKEQLSSAPFITEANILNDSTVMIKWDMFKDSTLRLLKNYEISVADDDDGEFKTIIANISKDAKTAVCSTPLSSNYFIISAIDINGQKYSSFPRLVQTIDSVPPAPPIGLTGLIDSNNVVHLTWTPNKESDLLGYYVLRANVATDEMNVITAKVVTGTTYTDTLSTKLGNEKIYYALVALDQRYNQSKLSDTVALTRPDLNPPVAPVFKDFKLSENKVELSWENGNSDDVITQRLYKKVFNNGTNDNNWQLLKEFNSLDSTHYTDNKVNAGAVVGYTLIAVDKNKNESTPSVPLTVTIPLDKKDKVAVKELTAVADRKSKKILVEWVYTEKGVVEYQIYKTAAKKPISLWKVAENTSVAIIDEDISPGNVYKYAIRAVFNDGTMSQMKEVNVEF
jgi:uncharacterized protein